MVSLGGIRDVAAGWGIFGRVLVGLYSGHGMSREQELETTNTKNQLHISRSKSKLPTMGP